MTRARFAVEEMDEATCRRLLGTAPIGRVGFISRALPKVLPVHCALRGDEIVAASLHGTEALRPRTGEIIAFEVDSYDPRTREGWCVSVVGRCRVVTDAGEIAELHDMDFTPGDTDQGVYFVVPISVIHGRRLDRVPAISSR